MSSRVTPGRLRPGRLGTFGLVWLASAALLGTLTPMATPVAAATPDDSSDAPRASKAAPDRVDGAFEVPDARHKRADMDASVEAIAQASAERGAKKAAAHAKDLGLEVEQGRIRLVVETRNARVAERSAAELGVEVEAATTDLVQVLVAPGQLRTLQAAKGVDYVRPPLTFTEGAVGGEGVGAVNADAWHALGITGDGVKVAVIDTGFAGLAAAKASGDLPADVTTVDHCSGGFATASEHGTAVAEIVHEMAPAAELVLMCIGTEVDLAQAVDDAKARGVDVINHSVGWLNAGRGDGTGRPGSPDAIVADAAAAGILWVNSAGNEAMTHWSGTFVDGGDGFHDFGGGDLGNSFFVGEGDVACVVLKWDDWPGTDQDFDLYIGDAYGSLVAGSETLQNGAQAPTEATCFQNYRRSGTSSSRPSAGMRPRKRRASTCSSWAWGTSSTRSRPAACSSPHRRRPCWRRARSAGPARPSSRSARAAPRSTAG